MEQIKGMSVYSIASEMVNMGIFSVEDIQKYGYTEEEAKEIKEEIEKL